MKGLQVMKQKAALMFYNHVLLCYLLTKPPSSCTVLYSVPSVLLFQKQLYGNFMTVAKKLCCCCSWKSQVTKKIVPLNFLE